MEFSSDEIEDINGFKLTNYTNKKEYEKMISKEDFLALSTENNIFDAKFVNNSTNEKENELDNESSLKASSNEEIDTSRDNIQLIDGKQKLIKSKRSKKKKD